MEETPNGAEVDVLDDDLADVEDDDYRRRSLREVLSTAGETLMPYWFAFSGIGLGIGGVITDKPLAGACGAVAGVTAGLVYQQRAGVFRREAAHARGRQRTQQARFKRESADLRHEIAQMRSELWELRLAAQVTQMSEALAAARATVTTEIPVVTVEEPKVEEPKVETPKVEEPKVEEPVAAKIEEQVDVEEPKVEDAPAEVEAKTEEVKPEVKTEDVMKAEDAVKAEDAAKEAAPEQAPAPKAKPRAAKPKTSVEAKAA